LPFGYITWKVGAAAMSTPDKQPSLAEFSPISDLARRIFATGKTLSPMNWLRPCCPLLKPRNEITPEEVASKDFTRRRAKAVEMYIAGWLIVEVLLVVLVCATGLPALGRVAVGLVVGLRVLEILQVTVNAAIFDSLSGRRDNRVASTTRMVVLAFLNFVELFVCFGVVYAADLLRLEGAGQPLTAFYFSIITQLTIGFGDVYPTGYLRIVVALQGLVGVTFIVLLLARFVAALPHIETILEPEAVEGAAEQSAPGDAKKPRT
jgi:hypothetical protein